MAGPVIWAAALSFAVWVYMLTGRHQFWRAGERLGPAAGELDHWPSVTAVVPARNEAASVAECLRSLIGQDYRGGFSIIAIDDSSTDGTGEIMRAIARESDVPVRVIDSTPVAGGWTGKLWALQQGVAEARSRSAGSDYLWFTDADIVHGPMTLANLVAKAEREGRDVVSLMVRLHCRGLWERLIIPAFVFFFQKLYPFRAVNDDRNRTAAAAGGCILLRPGRLEGIGGLAAIRGEIIDDCALARSVKRSGGGLWLGLAEDSSSIRPYETLGGLWTMIARGAYNQLRYSPLLLAGTVVGMVLMYLAPVLLVALWPWHGDALAAGLGGSAWLLMTCCYLPTITYYRQPAWTATLLPLVAGLYMVITVDSAFRHWCGRGGEWKQRYYDGR